MRNFKSSGLGTHVFEAPLREWHRVMILGMAVACLLPFGGIGCHRENTAKPTPPSQKAATSSNDAAKEKDPTSAATLPVMFSVPEFELMDQAGERFGSKELKGNVWIANFIFTSCTATCPRQTAKLAELQSIVQQLPDADRIRFVSITVDPETDTSTRLGDYARAQNAVWAHWKFLTGTRKDLWSLCAEGFKLAVAESAKDSKVLITHSSRFALVDKQCRIRGYYESQSDDDVRKLMVDMRSLLSEPLEGDQQVLHIAVPRDVFSPPWLTQRAADQIAKRDEMQPEHDFRFVDRIDESGIRFVHRAVPEARSKYRPNHYDHGNGIAAADVDGDGLIDLLFLSQIGGNQLWRNVGNGQFEDMTERAGVALKGRVSVGASFADTDNDGDVDLYVTTTRHGNAFFENDGHGKFQDRTEAAGLVQVAHSSGADFFDYDRDGLLDLFVTNVGLFTTDEVANGGGPGEPNSPYYSGIVDSFSGHLFPHRFEQSVLYHNEGGNRFRDVSDQTGLVHKKWSGDATALDFNQDGWLDLYVVNMQGNDELYQNIDGKRFECRSAEVFPLSVWGGMCAKSFDYNNDGQLDLFITNMHADMWKRGDGGNLGPVELQKAPQDVLPESLLKSRVPGKNVLGNGFYEHRKGQFVEVSDQINAETFWPWGHTAADLNADGFQDLFICASMNYPFRYHHNSVLLNDRGQNFVPAEFILGVEPRLGDKTATRWFDLDCAGADAANPICHGCGGPVTVWAALGTRSSAIFDLDQDGDLDVVTNDFNSRPMVLVSDLSERRTNLHYLSIRLQGTKSNRQGFGATVQVSAGGKVFTQVNDGQSGYLSQSNLPLYFGLGDIEKVDQIAIRWLGGKEQILKAPIDANREMTIVEE